MTVANYIYDKYNERGMRAFEKRISKILKANGLTQGEAIAHNAFMQRGNGSGSYYRVAEIQIDDEIYFLKNHTHDSTIWDDWNDPTPKQKRQLFEAVLLDEMVSLLEQIAEYNETLKEYDEL